MKMPIACTTRTAAVTFFDGMERGKFDGRVANGSSAINNKVPEAEASGEFFRTYVRFL
jgi:hypothetical protein